MSRYRRIFPCFSSRDTDVVDGVAAVAEALGDDYLDQVLAAGRSDAPSGWLVPLIAEADIFQLFWSSHSMLSSACRQQWEQALATGREGFVLPLYWEQPFPRAAGLPPPALESLRFVRLPGTLAPAPPVAPSPTTPTTPITPWDEPGQPGVAPLVPPPADMPSAPGTVDSPPLPTHTAPAPSVAAPPAPDASAPVPVRGRGPLSSRLGAAGLAAALLAVGFIAVGWSPGAVPGSQGSILDLIGLALIGVALALGGLAVTAWFRHR